MRHSGVDCRQINHASPSISYLTLSLRRTKPDGRSSTCRTCFNQRVNATRDEKRALKRSRLAGTQQGRGDAAADGSGHLVSAQGPHLMPAAVAVKRRRREAEVPAHEHLRMSMAPGPAECSILAQHLAALQNGSGASGRLHGGSQRDGTPLVMTAAGALSGRQVCPTCFEMLPPARFPPRAQAGSTSYECVECGTRARLRQQMSGQIALAERDAVLHPVQQRPGSAGMLPANTCAMLMRGFGVTTSQPEGSNGLWPCNDLSRCSTSAGGSDAPHRQSSSTLPHPATLPLPTQRCPQCQRVMPAAVTGHRTGARQGLCSLCQLAVQLLASSPQQRLCMPPGPDCRWGPVYGCQPSTSLGSLLTREQQPAAGAPAANEASWSQAAFRHGCAF